jgi:hypothetical protein
MGLRWEHDAMGWRIERHALQEQTVFYSPLLDRIDADPTKRFPKGIAECRRINFCQLVKDGRFFVIEREARLQTDGS